MYFYRIYSETSTIGIIKDVYGVSGGLTVDTFVVEYQLPQYNLPHGIVVLPNNNVDGK